MPTELEEYFFDLQGFLILKAALSKEEVQKINAAIDSIPPLKPQQWHGHVHRQDHDETRGVNLQNIVEGGEVFESLIDHPSWIEHARRFVGDDGLFIDECFASFRGPGEFINIHSGGHHNRQRTKYSYRAGKFACGQVNVLVALTNIAEGDGATTIIPASHKANICHPKLDRPYHEVVKEAADNVEGAHEVHMQAGDALLFVDALCHGSAARFNEGERRILVYRYGPNWGNTRFGYRPSPELLERLSPARRKIIQPIAPLCPR